MLLTVQRIISRGAPRTLGHRGFSQIPVVDVSALMQAHSSAQDYQEAAAALHEAARRVGFFYAANTGVPADLCSNILTQARQWFDLPVGSYCKVCTTIFLWCTPCTLRHVNMCVAVRRKRQSSR
jgi:isopenicillin N synthase-like dioxygenase